MQDNGKGKLTIRCGCFGCLLELVGLVGICYICGCEWSRELVMRCVSEIHAAWSGRADETGKVPTGAEGRAQ